MNNEINGGIRQGNSAGTSLSANGGGPGPALMSSSTLSGNDVYNHKGEDLGKVKDFMIDMRTGRLVYGVLSFGGFLGMGNKLFAVPFNALKLDTLNKRFTLNVEKSRLESAPGFNQDSWPNMADQSWSDSIHAYYGTKPLPRDLSL